MTTKITTEVIDSGAITEEKLANNAVATGKIATGAVTETKLASNSVTASKIAANAVGSSEIADGAITNAKIASMAASKLTGALPAISGANLTGVEPPTDYNAIGTYRLIGITTPYISNTSSLFNGIGNTFTSNDYGLSSSHTYRLMGGTAVGETSPLGQITYSHTVLIVRVS